MAKRKSSKQWLKERLNDPYIRKLQHSHYRSRACFKLLELQAKDHFIKPGITIVDLGSAPGGWSQVAAELSGPKGRVIALDSLPMAPIAGVEFLQGDFTDTTVYEALLALIGATPVELVISDMAPNISGISDVDQPQAMYLVELALAMAASVLRPNGTFVVKVFQGEGFSLYIKACRERFARVIIRKPNASRSRSREVYLVATGFKA